MTKRILITGSTGFIGRNLNERLRDDYSISAPTHDELELLDALAVAGFLKRNKFTVVIHTATWDATRNSKKDISKTLSNNLKMFSNLIQCNEHYGKLIYYGSGAEYGREHWTPRMREDYFNKYIPGDDYGLSKYTMSKYAERIGNAYNMRLFGVFGKYEDWEIRFISNACCKAVWDLPITVKQNVFFDYLYVNDLAEITKWFIENDPKNKFYNVCTGKVFDLVTLAKKVLAASGKNLKILIGQQGLGKEYSGDNTRLISEIGNYKFQDIDASIKELYNWYLANKRSIPIDRLKTDK
ncbi:MAG: NAD-dependent dehydratase [Candidatus Omnitrophica bacterium CG07_land_8_20_14_0_80_42_15]|uniref:NAD-dependent dehydratase n=1 Tax=Candidatus Aquitaenariimonas noxiae TaxID=1974741 RepID=A0A2J0KXW2_9BACT|nr:MAG: NAD-dependent dehydratase [Candidatus Omnitrophica bacterium CG07_land_8_20_14_0_80_42_15]